MDGSTEEWGQMNPNRGLTPMSTTICHEVAEDKMQMGTRMRNIRRRRIVMFSLCLALFLSALDITIVGTALPTIARHLGASTAEYAWIGSCYTLANTSSIAIWAKLSDIFGRKPIIMLSNATFLAGSLISGLANSVSVLIGGRIVQGLGAGGCTILVTIVISDLFALRDRAKYYGITGIVYAISSSLGPVLGGVFTQTIGWRWCFFINLPFDGVSLIVLLYALEIHNPKTPLVVGLKSLDWIGSILIVGGTICFLYGLESGAGGQQAWNSVQVIALLVSGAVLLLLFGVYEHWFARYPLVPTRIFSRRTNVASFLVLCLHGFVFISYDYFLPLYFQTALHLTPIISGVSLFALVLPLSAATMGAGWYVKKSRDYLLPTWIGAVLMTTGTGLFIDFGAHTNWVKIILFQMVAGLGAGPLFQAPMIAFQSHLAQKDIAAASSASSFLRSLSSSMSIVIGSVLLQKRLARGQLTPDKGSAAISPSEYVSAMRLMWTFFTAISALIVIISLLIEKMPDPESQSESTGQEPAMSAHRAEES
ncbi:hypothetical protein HRR86_007549 [Exophiala dermatitidis]|nr:hypothetical protein HRR74_007591 [Exophiala dermatitidis]KAJ4510251.1 hypothetical protein HRR73_007049 [Exophiala dermatitidis]KAJ4539264.1 hypothetical protein HRR77_006671 [Exophiala dermatitidis]KAJ4564712.1 hypothetical protein HRR79_005962 [Exophiala dermatitidis]KAJ4573161.1 hypothetical protein HRR82_006813 [Exophiala dermatitidis]